MEEGEGSSPRRRLKVFESITRAESESDEESEEISRHLEIRGLKGLSAEQVRAGLQKYGEIQVFDSRFLHEGLVYVSYYDLRDSEAAKRQVGRFSEVRYMQSPNDPAFCDYVPVLRDEYFHNSTIAGILNRAGEILGTKLVGKCVLVQFFDLRHARRAYSEISCMEQPEEVESEESQAENIKLYENQFHDSPLSPSKEVSLNISIGSESTAPSPYFCGFSSLSSEGRSSSRESFEEHRRKPKKKPLDEEEKVHFIINLGAVARGEDNRTTVMIRNIPNKYTQQMLLSTINKKFSGTYDFVYLPIDFKNKCGVGYAFINFLDPKVIIDFFQEFNGKRWERFNSEKVCALAYARIQGRQALIQHFASSSVMNQHDDKKQEACQLVSNRISNLLSSRKYKPAEASNWITQLCDESISDLTKLNNNFKYLVTCIISEKSGLALASSCHYSSCDSSLLVQWENKYLRVMVNIFAVAL